MSWTDGYVADTAYTNHFYAELAPTHLDFVALNAGFAPPDHDDGRFRYCELGCGNGASTNLLAVSNPDATFVGIDFMPADLDYTFAFTPPAGRLVAHMKTVRAGSVCFDATLSLEQRPWSAPEIRALGGSPTVRCRSEPP